MPADGLIMSHVDEGEAMRRTWMSIEEILVENGIIVGEICC